MECRTHSSKNIFLSGTLKGRLFKGGLFNLQYRQFCRHCFIFIALQPPESQNYFAMKNILFGIDVFCGQSKTYRNSRLGLITNNAATTTRGSSSRTSLQKAGFNITKLFSPEHGLNARGEDGAFQNNHTDPATGLPVISLYGLHLSPGAEDLADIDMLLFDIPDAGCRFYTYLWTMTYAMEACARWQKPLLVLDRPNPIGANLAHAEGPWLDEASCSSFIGRWNIPVRHSCTLGELANFFAATRVKDLDLRIIKVQQWERTETAAAAGWHFVPTSPAISDAATAMLYPGMGLLEGVQINEGRGTTTPFKRMGAPWIDAKKLQEVFSALHLPGIEAGITHYIPAEGMHAGALCHGLQFTVTEEQGFFPVRTGLLLLQKIIQLYPAACQQRLYPTVANPAGTGHLDKLTGVKDSFEKLKSGELLPMTTLQQEWTSIIQPYLLY